MAKGNHMAYQPKTGARCSCRRGIVRDNCSTCEGTGWCIDFHAIRRATGADRRLEKPPTCGKSELGVKKGEKPE